MAAFKDRPTARRECDGGKICQDLGRDTIIGATKQKGEAPPTSLLACVACSSCLVLPAIGIDLILRFRSPAAASEMDIKTH